MRRWFEVPSTAEGLRAPDLTPQLAAIARELEDARERAHRLGAAIDEERWGQRSTPGRWSMGECVAHLNLTSEAYLPLIRDAIERGPRLKLPSRSRYRRDLIGCFLCWAAEPPVRLRVKTTAPFVPTAPGSRAEVLTQFDRLQAQLVDCLRAADGLHLGKLKIRSPFDRRLRYNLYSCFRVIPAHQRRHLWQAEQVLRALVSTGEGGAE